MPANRSMNLNVAKFAPYKGQTLPREADKYFMTPCDLSGKVSEAICQDRHHDQLLKILLKKCLSRDSSCL